ncbi:MAG: hypothetical protein AAB969_03105 [Patescibacteria group bacterium]
MIISGLIFVLGVVFTILYLMIVPDQGKESHKALNLIAIVFFIAIFLASIVYNYISLS